MNLGSVFIRRAVIDDADRLALVGAASFLEAFADSLPGDDIARHCAGQHAPLVYAGWLSGGGARIWIAETEGGPAPVGYVVLDEPALPLRDIGPGDIEIKRIYLLHRFQGRRIGAALMSTALDAAREAGKSRALLGVYSRNAGAIAFYTKFGFAIVGERRFQVGATWCDDIVMAAPLA